jgi:hypothetical protein
MLKVLQAMGAALPSGQNDPEGQTSFWEMEGQYMPCGQTSGSNNPCGVGQYWPSNLRLLHRGLGLHMAATAEALLKLAPGTTKPGGMSSGKGRSRRGGPKKQPDCQECASAGVTKSRRSAYAADIVKGTKRHALRSCLKTSSVAAAAAGDDDGVGEMPTTVQLA